MNKLKGLYAITGDNLMTSSDFKNTVSAILNGGAKIIQYRNKKPDSKQQLQQCQLLRTLCFEHQALLIINDDISLAKEVNADGVHLGKDDVNIEQARKLLGEKMIIGASCYNQLDLALAAQEKGANYVAFGAFFDSPTKTEACKASLDLLVEAKKQLRIPICAIGGINEHNASQLIDSGADMIAVISALSRSNNIRATTQAFISLFPHGSRS